MAALVNSQALGIRACMVEPEELQAEGVSGIAEEDDENTSSGYRLRDGRLDHVSMFDANVFLPDTSRVQPLIIVGRCGKERLGFMVVQAPPGEEGCVRTVEVTGRRRQLQMTDSEGKVTVAWVFDRGRSHVRLTLDAAGSDHFQKANCDWFGSTPGLADQLASSPLVNESSAAAPGVRPEG